MADVLDTDLLLLNRPDENNPKTYKISVSDLPSSSVSTGDTEPSDPKNGDLWWNTTDNTLYVYYNDGNTEQWVVTNPGGSDLPGSSVSTGDEAPNNPKDGDLWWNTNDNTLYVYYNDGNTEQWVVTNPGGGGSSEPPAQDINIDGGSAVSNFGGVIIAGLDGGGAAG